MKAVNIGFMGGCLNNQKGIAKDEFYYEVFSGLLSNVPHHVFTSIYISYDTMVAKTEKFIEINNIDVLFLVIRQFPLMPLYKPLIKYENKNGGTSWMIHPSLFRRKLGWNPGLSKYHT